MNAISPALARNPWLTHTARVLRIVPEIDGVATYHLTRDDVHDADAYQFQAGQFNMLYLPGVGESAISMSGDPESCDAWIHTVRVAGSVTRSLAQLKCGDTLGVRGPFGAGWPVDDLVGTDVVVVAGGLGMAPLRPLIYQFVHHRTQFGGISLIIGARTPDVLLFQNEYDEWRQAGIDVQVTVDRATPGWSGSIGVVTALMDRLRIADAQQTRIVACGPEVMMKYAALTGIQRGISTDHIWVSMERNMQCAAGLCGHCQLGPSFICKDGPVIRYDRLQPYLFVESL